MRYIIEIFLKAASLTPHDSEITLRIWVLSTHYNDVIMSAMVSQITSLIIVNSSVYSSSDDRALRRGEENSPVAGEFPAQRASNAENVSSWWCHHAVPNYKKSYQITCVIHRMDCNSTAHDRGQNFIPIVVDWQAIHQHVMFNFWSPRNLKEI